MRRGLGLAALSVLWSAASPAQNLGFRMLNDATNPFPYYIDGRLLSPAGNLNLSQIQQATDESWNTWAAVPCNDDAFLSLGLSTNNPSILDPRDPFDAYNVSTIWIVDAGDPYYDYALSGGVLGAALPQAYGGILYTCDIYLNAVDYTWSLDGGAVGGLWADLISVLLHEMGHCQGLGHTNDFNDVMYSFEPIGFEKRTLSNTDVQLICSVAPKSGAVGSPCATTPDCVNAALTCVTPPLPDGGAAESMCSMACSPTSATVQCPTPFVCVQSSLIAGSTGACLTPESYVTQVGKACTVNGDCGSASGVCQQPGTLPSGFEEWANGYCMEPCGTQFQPCPATSVCVTAPNFSECLQTCRPGLADCRPQYACQPFGDGTQGYCEPACHADQDCGGAGFVCRLCDGLCLAQQTPTAQIGDPCMSPANCGLGQLCLGFGANATTGICSMSCGSPCADCPNGSTCAPVGTGGALFCLIACPNGNCPNGLQCTQTSVGPVCVEEACQVSAQCPVGDQCFNGVCHNPSDGGNTCPLCMNADGGGSGYVPQTGTDGGTRNGNAGGCGCGAGAAPVLGLALALLALAGRRRRLPR